jgi:hypothetical protein
MKTRLVKFALLAAVLLLLITTLANKFSAAIADQAWLPHGDYPLIDVVAKQQGAQVIFEASWPRPPNASSSRVPVRIFELTVYSNGSDVSLWKIVTPNYVGATSRIVYGQAPRGYLQTVPENGSPAKLEAGTYRATVRGDGGIGGVEFEVKAEK